MVAIWDGVYNIGSTILAYLWWVCALVVIIAIVQYARRLWRWDKIKKNKDEESPELKAINALAHQIAEMSGKEDRQEGSGNDADKSGRANNQD